MKKILVAIDLARGGGNDMVMTAALKLANAMDGTVSALHVISPPPSYVVAEIPMDILQNRVTKAEEDLRELAERYGCSDTMVCEGSPAAEIMDYAEKIDADLIVLHSHDPDLSDYFLGSVAGRVVRHAHCSVHIVRHAK
jgi:universal stress protein F